MNEEPISWTICSSAVVEGTATRTEAAKRGRATSVLEVWLLLLPLGKAAPAVTFKDTLKIDGAP